MAQHQNPSADQIRKALAKIFLGTAPTALTLEQSIYERFVEYVDFLDEIGREDGQFRHAAVLVPLIERPSGVHVLLTRRSEQLENHRGQISFPGGTIEADDEDSTAAALRETEEEVGIHPRHVQVMGYMEPFETFTGFSIHPVIAWVEPDAEIVIDEAEVAEAFEMPLSFVLDRANRKTGYRDVKQGRLDYSILPYKDYQIWGATAGVLVKLADDLTAELQAT